MLALTKLLERLQSGKTRLLRGKITVAPRVNAAAAKRGLHFVEENLNRIVRAHAAPGTHEQRLANELIALIDAADVVLDLHGTSAPTLPFVFLDDESPENRAWAESLGVDYLLTGWPALYAGSKTVTTTEYAQSRGKRALTVEAGRNDDPAAAETGLEVALRTLAHFGLTEPAAPAPPPTPLRLKQVFYREQEGEFAWDWQNFDTLNADEVLARYADGCELTAPGDGFMVMPFEGAEFGSEWFYFAAPD